MHDLKLHCLKCLPVAAFLAGLAVVSVPSVQAQTKAQDQVTDPSVGNGKSPTAGPTSAGNTPTTAATPYQQNRGAGRNELGNNPVGSNATMQGRSMPGSGSSE